MRVDVQHGWEAFGALEREWNDLLESSRADSIFLRWEWIDAWRRVVGGTVQPLLVVVRDDRGGLAGLGPFYVSGSRVLRTVPYRMLRILGDYNSGAEYQDWIARRDVEQQATVAIAEALREQDGWDCAWLPYVADWTGAHDRIVSACAEGALRVQAREAKFSAVTLPTEYQSFLRSLSGNARSMLKRRTQQIMKLPGMQFRRCTAEDEREHYLAALFDLHGRRWRAAGLPGGFVRRPSMVKFYREFSRTALQRGWLHMSALFSGATILAVQYGYVYRGTFYQLQEGFEPDAPDGIGNVLRSHVIQACINEGVHTYDFLGGFTEHKRRWGGTLRTGRRLLVGRNTLKTQAVFGVGMWPTGRYFKLEPLREASA